MGVLLEVRFLRLEVRAQLKQLRLQPGGRCGVAGLAPLGGGLRGHLCNR